MTIYNSNKTILLLPLMITTLFATEPSVIGCSSFISKDISGCDSKNIITEEKKDIFKIQEELFVPQNIQTNISEKMKSVKILHKGKELTIVRNIHDVNKSCPPFCIVPMSIEGVKTVGELEVLDFLKNLNDKGNNLVLDTRESRYYNKGTIPGALNLPSHMLLKDSKYFDDVIAVLGIKKINDNKQVEEIHMLLIFDDGITDSKASEAIESLLKLSYPSDKILYYRGGFSSWKSLGLTLN
jgi:rhodanese-related sulfurtransferase